MIILNIKKKRTLYNNKNLYKNFLKVTNDFNLSKNYDVGCLALVQYDYRL